MTEITGIKVRLIGWIVIGALLLLASFLMAGNVDKTPLVVAFAGGITFALGTAALVWLHLEVKRWQE